MYKKFFATIVSVSFLTTSLVCASGQKVPTADEYLSSNMMFVKLREDASKHSLMLDGFEFVIYTTDSIHIRNIKRAYNAVVRTERSGQKFKTTEDFLAMAQKNLKPDSFAK